MSALLLILWSKECDSQNGGNVSIVCSILRFKQKDYPCSNLWGDLCASWQRCCKCWAMLQACSRLRDLRSHRLNHRILLRVARAAMHCSSCRRSWYSGRWALWKLARPSWRILQTIVAAAWSPGVIHVLLYWETQYWWTLCIAVIQICKARNDSVCKDCKDLEDLSATQRSIFAQKLQILWWAARLEGLCDFNQATPTQEKAPICPHLTRT